MQAGVTATFGVPRGLELAQASAVLCAAWIAVGLWAPLVATAAGAVFLLYLLGRELGEQRALSPPNAVTLLRLLLTVVLAALGARERGPELALLVFAIFALDGLDGWLARRLGLASSFGARFDMECDALLVLTCSLCLFSSGRLPAFILVPGLLRYLYVLGCALIPGEAREAPRSRVGRHAFALMALSFAASFWPLPHHEWLALFATTLIACSFGRSFAYSLRSVA
jgi:phosphatidylglycerophosphate synthase